MSSIQRLLDVSDPTFRCRPLSNGGLRLAPLNAAIAYDEYSVASHAKGIGVRFSSSNKSSRYCGKKRTCGHLLVTTRTVLYIHREREPALIFIKDNKSWSQCVLQFTPFVIWKKSFGNPCFYAKGGHFLSCHTTRDWLLNKKHLNRASNNPKN